MPSKTIKMSFLNHYTSEFYVIMQI